MFFSQKLVFVAITLFFLITILGFVLLSSRQNSQTQTTSPHQKWTLLDKEENNLLCKNTAQGKIFITDNTGSLNLRTFIRP
jgi:preprotein translocase subunit SecG